MATKRIPVLVRTLLIQLLGFMLGAAAGWFLSPTTGEFGDAFRPYIAVAFGIVGFFLSSIYVAWLCCRLL